MPLIRRLCKHGNSLAIVIPRSILALQDIDETTPLRLTVRGGALWVTKEAATRGKPGARRRKSPRR